MVGFFRREDSPRAGFVCLCCIRLQARFVLQCSFSTLSSGATQRNTVRDSCGVPSEHAQTLFRRRHAPNVRRRVTLRGERMAPPFKLNRRHPKMKDVNGSKRRMDQ